MVKFGKIPKPKTFSKKEKKKKEKVSPLMADDEEQPKSSRSSRSAMTSESSRSAKDIQREAQRAEREERRKKRDGRLADESAKKTSSKSKKKSSKPKLSQEEQDAKDAKLGWCAKFGIFMVKLVHFIDGAIGLTFLIYGGLMLTEFENPAMEAVIASLTFGSVLLCTAIMGVIGFTTHHCKRIGLAISGYTAPLIAFFYIFVIIALLTSSGMYFDYLTENKDVMYLNDAEILILKQILPFFYIAMASLAAIEITRFFTLRKIRHKLLAKDAATKRITESHVSSSSRSNNSSKKSSSSRSSKRGGSNQSKLTEPLIEKDEELGGGDSSSEDGDW